MIRITILILALVSMVSCGCVKESSLVLESDLWVMASDKDSYSMPYELKAKNVVPSIEFPGQTHEKKIIQLSCPS